MIIDKLDYFFLILLQQQQKIKYINKDKKYFSF